MAANNTGCNLGPALHWNILTGHCYGLRELGAPRWSSAHLLGSAMSRVAMLCPTRKD